MVILYYRINCPVWILNHIIDIIVQFMWNYLDNVKYIWIIVGLWCQVFL